MLTKTAVKTNAVIEEHRRRCAEAEEPWRSVAKIASMFGISKDVYVSQWVQGVYGQQTRDGR